MQSSPSRRGASNSYRSTHWVVVHTGNANPMVRGGSDLLHLGKLMILGMNDLRLKESDDWSNSEPKRSNSKMKRGRNKKPS